MPVQQLPPPGVMIREARTPNPVDTFFRELVSRESERFREANPIPRGTLYSDTARADVKISEAYPLLYFLRETVPIGSNTVAGTSQREWTIWEWATDVDAESNFNAEVSYLGDAVLNPVFARSYLIRRDLYDATPKIATGTPFTGLIGVKIVNGGTKYTEAHPTFVGSGSDSEAKVEFVISDGVIISAIVTDEGVDFNAASSIQIIGDGEGAQAELILQPVAAILTSQKKVELPDGDPYSLEFVRALRVYEVLPGPWIPVTRYDDDLGPIQGRRRAVLNTGQVGGQITPTGKTNYEGRDGSSVVSIEIQENFSDGTGNPGPGGVPNPLYPILVWDVYIDERGPVQRTTQIVRATGNEVATFLRSGSDPNVTVTKTWFEPYADNPYLLKKFIETWIEVIHHDRKITSEFGGGELAITERTASPGSQSLQPSLTTTVDELRTKSPDEQTRHTEKLSGASSWPILPGVHTDEITGIVVNYTKQYVDKGTLYPGRSGYRGPFVEIQPYDFLRSIQIISAVDCSTLPGPEGWTEYRAFNLPPTLLSIEAVWSDFVGKSAEGTADTSNSSGGVSVSVHSGSSGGVIVTSRNGYRGYAKTLVGRYYKCGQFTAAELALFNIFKILPSSGSVIITSTDSNTFFSRSDDLTGSATTNSVAASSFAGGRIGDNFSNQVHAIDIRDHLVGAPVFGPAGLGQYSILGASHTSQAVSAIAQSGGGRIGSVSANGTVSSMEVRIPQSTPPYLVSGQQILTEIDLVEWRLGVWVLTVYYTTIP